MYSKAEIQHIYRHRARHYNLTANIYYLFGFREYAYRKMAVQQLGLKPGDCVVDLGCGTGLNFPLLQAAVGPRGRIVGVDLTEAMLTEAKLQIEHKHWSNVELINCDAARFNFPRHANAVISTFAYTLIPEHANVTRRIASTLASGSRMVILDLKQPDHWPRWIFRFALFITRPFAVTEEYAKQHPWLEMKKSLKNFAIKELFWGGAYLASGEVP